MRLLLYSYFAPLSEQQLGGAQQVMHDLLVGLVGHGFNVTYLCPRQSRADLLDLGPALQLRPTLHNPQRRALLPYEHLENLRAVAEAAREADVVLTIDRALPVDIDIPVVAMSQNFSYPLEMESVWSDRWDRLVVPSSYLARVAGAFVGPEFWEGVPPTIEVIPNGIDTEFFSRRDPVGLCRRLQLDPSADYLLFPHRPDMHKGFEDALAAVRLLRDRGRDYRLLVPMNLAYREDIRYYNSLRSRAAHLGIAEAVVFHDWVPLRDLPAYFSLAKWCLTLSALPEGFGLTPVQSVSCGTPVVSTRSGALGELFPPRHGVRYVDIGRPTQVADAMEAPVGVDESAQGRHHAVARYSAQHMVSAYAQTLRRLRKTSARYAPRRPGGRVRLSPWCHLEGATAVWHDYRMCRYRLTRKEQEVVARAADEQGLSALADGGVVRSLLARGILMGDLP